MSKNTNLSFLTDYITADITNGRIGINNASPAYAFDVTGVARTSTSTYLATASGGNVGIGTTSPSSLSQFQKFLHIDGGASSNVALCLSGQNNAGQGTIGYDTNTLYIDALGATTGTNNNITFNTTSVNSSNSRLERMRITAAGNVGIGSTTAGAQLTLAQNNANTSAQPYLTFRNLATGYGSWSIWKNGGNDLAFYYGVDSDTPSAGINMKLRYNGITEFQNTVLINTTTSNSYPLELEAFTGGNQIYLRRDGANAKIFMGGSTGASTALYIQSFNTNGVYLTAGGTSWTANSDIRLKNIISPIDSAVDKLTTLNPVIFSWKSDEENKENIGLIAQDVKEVFPQVIDTNEDGFLGVRYSELVPVLVKAIQELKAEINLLKQK